MEPKNCMKCLHWARVANSRRGVKIPDGVGKCTRPGGHCDPDVVKGKIGVGAIIRKKGDAA